jgi:hypothetical protein
VKIRSSEREEQVSEGQRSSEASHAIQWAAKIGISCQFAALVRILAELIWLHHRGAGNPSAPSVGVYLIGAVIAAVLCWASVMVLWIGRARLSIAITATTIVTLLAIKLWAVRAGLL